MQSWLLQTPRHLTPLGVAFIQQLVALRTLSLNCMDTIRATHLDQCSLPELRYLCLRCAGIDEAVVEPLVQCQLPQLRHLDLSDSELTVLGLNHLAQGKWPWLTSLHIGRSSWGGDQHSQPALDPLASSNWPLLRQLSASGWTCLHLLTAATQRRWPQLKSFEASHVHGEADLVIAGLKRIKLQHLTDIASIDNLVAVQWPSLRSLTISTGAGFAIAQAMDKLAALGTWPVLETLRLSYNKLGGYVLLPLSLAQWPLLRKLHLVTCSLNAESAQCLKACGFDQLSELNLSNNHIGATAMTYLVQAKWPSLEVLKLDGNPLDPEAVRLLATGPWAKLKFLTMGSCNLTFAALRFLFEGQWPSMCHLDLEPNEDLTAEDVVIACHGFLGKGGCAFSNLFWKWVRSYHEAVESGSVNDLELLLEA